MILMALNLFLMVVIFLLLVYALTWSLLGSD
jgi:hypothetical protein